MNRVPFDPKELIPLSVEKAIMPGFPDKPVYNSPITNRENFALSLKREKPMWMPNTFTDYDMICPEVPDNIARAFVFEKKPMDFNHVGGPDMFGVEWEYVPSVGGSMVRGGNPKIPDIANWEKYITFPDLEEIIDWETISQRNKEYGSERKTLTVSILNGLFERLISFMDMSNALMAMIDEDEQEGVHRLFDKLADMYDQYIGLYKKYFNCQMIQFHDDWGSQRAPFFSPNTLREMVLPYLKRVVESAHKNGCFFEMHSCGKNEILVPIMLEAGVDLWQPQFMNDYEAIYKESAGDMTITIPLKDYINEDMSDNEMSDKIAGFIDKFPKAQASSWFAPDRSAEMLYVESRKYFCD